MELRASPFAANNTHHISLLSPFQLPGQLCSSQFLHIPVSGPYSTKKSFPALFLQIRMKAPSSSGSVL